MQGAASEVFYAVYAEQSTHDLPIPMMWRGHLVVIALLATITLGAPALASRFTQSSTFADLLPLHQSLSIQPHVMSSQVMRGWTSGQGNTMHYLQSQLRLDAPLTADSVLARHVAQLMAKADSHLANEDAIVVVLVCGYELGIASGWKKQRYSFRPAEWAIK